MNLSFQSRKNIFLLALTSCVVFVYFRILSYPFIDFDDNFYVFNNPHIRSGISWSGIKWALTSDLFYDSAYVDYWQPLTAFSRLIDVAIFDLWAGGHHLNNLLLHLVNIYLLFRVLHTTSGQFFKSAVVASIFALHPMQVEAVAWATARKDLLAAFFILASCYFYLLFSKRDAEKYLFLSSIFYGLSLLAKPAYFFVPAILIFKKPRAKILFPFAIAGGIIFCANLFAKTAILGRIFSLDWYSRAFANVGFYVVKLLIPINLGIYKPFDGNEVLSWSLAGFCFFALILFILIRAYQKKDQILFLSLIFFLLSLFASVQIKMADRIMYLPQVGIWVAMVWGCSKKRVSWIWMVFIFLLLDRSYVQVGFWKDTRSLFEHSNSLSQNHYIAKNVLANEYETIGDRPSAVQLYREAIHANPYYLESFLNLGHLLLKENQTDEAIHHFERALSLNPHLAETYEFLGDAYLQKGDFARMYKFYSEAVRLKPDSVKSLNNLANALLRKGNIEEAVGIYEKVIQINPDLVEPHNNLAVIYEAARLYDKAFEQYQEVIRIAPQLPDINARMAHLLREWGKPKEAQFYDEKSS